MTKKTGKTRISLGPIVGPNARLAKREVDGEVSTIVVRKAREGEPIPDGAELSQIENPDCMCGHWQDMTTLYKSDGEGRATEGGPAQVATEAYRAGYDRIFGTKPCVGLA